VCEPVDEYPFTLIIPQIVNNISVSSYAAIIQKVISVERFACHRSGFCVIAAFPRNSILTLATTARGLVEVLIFINCIVTIRGLAGLLVLKALMEL